MSLAILHEQFIDKSKSDAVNPLIKSLSDASTPDTPRWVGRNNFTYRLRFCEAQTQGFNANYLGVALDVGESVVVGGKQTNNLGVDTPLFNGADVTSGSDAGGVYYDVLVDLNTDPMNAALAMATGNQLACTVDVEVVGPGNAEPPRLTFQFAIIVLRPAGTGGIPAMHIFATRTRLKSELLNILNIPNIAFVETTGTANGTIGNPSKPFTAEAAIASGAAVIHFGVGIFTFTIPDGYAGKWSGLGEDVNFLNVTCAGGANGANGTDSTLSPDPDNPDNLLGNDATSGQLGNAASPVHIHSAIPRSFSLAIAGPNGGNGGGAGDGGFYGSQQYGAQGGSGGDLYLFGCGRVQVTVGIEGSDGVYAAVTGPYIDGNLYYQNCSMISIVNPGNGTINDIGIDGTPGGIPSSNQIVYQD